jgi:hypothetical protein
VLVHDPPLRSFLLTTHLRNGAVRYQMPDVAVRVVRGARTVVGVAEHAQPAIEVVVDRTHPGLVKLSPDFELRTEAADVLLALLVVHATVSPVRLVTSIDHLMPPLPANYQPPGG